MTKKETQPKEHLTARLDMLIKPSMKANLIKLAEKDNRELSDFVRLQLSKLIKG